MQHPPRGPSVVLLASDQEWSARGLQVALAGEGFAVLRAWGGQQALGLTDSIRPDAVLLDATLPDLGALETCRRIAERTRAWAPTAIILFTSDAPDRAERLRALQAGAWDCVGQPVDVSLLLPRLHTFTAAKREYERLRDESLLDDDPSLYSARGLARHAREVGAAAARAHGALACVALSVAPLTAPPAGEVGTLGLLDRAAGHLGTVCRQVVRTADAVGRLSRTEIGIIAPATAPEGAQALVHRIEHELGHTPLREGERVIPLRLHAGVSAAADTAQADSGAPGMLDRAWRSLRAQLGGLPPTPAGGAPGPAARAG